jgi:hypothetical protein
MVSTNKFPELDRFVDSETGTGFTPRREAVRDPYFLTQLADSYLMRTSQTPLLGSAYAPPSVLAPLVRLRSRCSLRS